jgi:LPXTG-motif cell wall-anchored protein
MKTDPGVITESSVGTKIEIARVGTPDKTINIKDVHEVGAVLGASTQRLPATGTDNNIVLWGILQLVFGFLLGIVYFVRKRMKKLIPSILAVFSLIAIVLVGTQVFASSDIVVRVSEPKSPTGTSFNLDFAVIDIGDTPVAYTAGCYVRNSKTSESKFGADVAIQAGGNSGSCTIETGALAEGDNYLYVKLNGTKSEEVVVKYIPSDKGPGTPRDFSRTNISSCEHKIYFKTADDGGKTVRVELYRGTETEYTLNDGSKVADFSMGSNESKTHTQTVSDCNKTYYYAVRAFDAANNPSDSIGERVSTTVTTTTTGGTTETIEQAPTNPSGAVIVSESSIPAERGGAGGQVLGEGTDKLSITPEATPEGKVLGEETTPMTEKVTEAVNNRGIWAVAGGVLLLVGVLYFVYRRWTGRDIPPTK